VLSVGATPSPSHAINVPDTGAHPVPDAQQLTNVSVAVSNAVHFKTSSKAKQRKAHPADCKY